VKYPIVNEDGLEVYACTICGAYLKYGKMEFLSKWFMEIIESRRDLTVKLQFEYQHQQMEITIPAGVEVDTGCEWYGPLKLDLLY